MPADNDRLKEIIQDARLICLHKITLLQVQIGSDNPDVQTVQKEQELLFGQFDNADFWIEPIEFDEPSLLELIDQVDLAGPDELDGCFEAIHTLFSSLKEDILSSEESDPDSPVISKFNIGNGTGIFRPTLKIVTGSNYCFWQEIFKILYKSSGAN